MTRSFPSLLPLALALAACGPASPADSGTTGATNGSQLANPSLIVVGVYIQETDGSYTERGAELVFEVDASCYTWNRTAPTDAVVTGDHLHYNASDGNTYVDGSFSWTEFGPEHSQADVDAACAAGLDGAAKTVSWTDYFEEQHGELPPYYLRIKRAE